MKLEDSIIGEENKPGDVLHDKIAMAAAFEINAKLRK